MPEFFAETETIEDTIYGKGLDNETYDVKFNKPGLVGMSRTDKLPQERSNSGFFITINKMPNLEQYVAVGEVIGGLNSVTELINKKENFEIKDCGYLGKTQV